MIRREHELSTELREKMRGGNGKVEITSFINKPDLNNKGRLFGKIVLKPGCGIGYHVHETDCEIFYILKGIASYNDNGTTVTVQAGDVTVCPAGTGHGITNNTMENVELIALIVYE